MLPGIMFNTTNPATNYKTGTEFHLDFMVNQFVSTSIALGVQGYWYKQIEGDSGAGATLGPFMGESFGLGPAVMWVPESTKATSSSPSGCTTSRHQSPERRLGPDRDVLEILTGA